MSDFDSSPLTSSLSSARALLEQLPDAMALFQEDGAIVYVNAAGRSWSIGVPDAPSPLAVGATYLDSWRSASDDAAAVTAIDEALRAVLRGELTTFQRDCSFGSAAALRTASVNISPSQLGARPAALLTLRDITDQRQREKAQAAELERLALFNSLTTDALAISENGIVLDCNDTLCELLGYSREEIIGKRADSFVAPQDRQRVYEQIINNTGDLYEHLTPRKDGTLFEATVLGRRVTYQGRAIRGSSIRDLTTLKDAQRALSKAQEEKLHVQAALLAELSTPLIPLNERALVMPLIGSIDSQRAQQVLETLLTGIEQRRTSLVIIDITGVRTVDSHVASTLVRAAKASRLLGAHVVLTGIRAEVAQTLVRLGVDFAELTTKATLQDGIAYAIAQNR